MVRVQTKAKMINVERAACMRNCPLHAKSVCDQSLSTSRFIIFNLDADESYKQNVLSAALK